MAAVRKRRPIRGGTEGEAEYAAFMRELLSNAIQATNLAVTSQVAGTRPVVRQDFVADPAGDVTVNGVRGRFVTVTTQVPRALLTGLEYDDPDGGSPSNRAGGRGRVGD